VVKESVQRYSIGAPDYSLLGLWTQLPQTLHGCLRRGVSFQPILLMALHVTGARSAEVPRLKDQRYRHPAVGTDLLFLCYRQPGNYRLINT
jgi:hypothetical protein